MTDIDGDGLGDIICNVESVRSLNPLSPPTDPIVAATVVNAAGTAILHIYFAQVAITLELFERWRYDLVTPRPVYKDGSETEYIWISDMPKDWTALTRYYGDNYNCAGVRQASLPEWTLTLPPPSIEGTVTELDASAPQGGRHLHISIVYPEFPMYYNLIGKIGRVAAHWVWQDAIAQWTEVYDAPESVSQTITNPYNSAIPFVFAGGANVDFEWYLRLKVAVQTCYWCTTPPRTYQPGGLSNLLGLALVKSLLWIGGGPAMDRPRKGRRNR